MRKNVFNFCAMIVALVGAASCIGVGATIGLRGGAAYLLPALVSCVISAARNLKDLRS